LARAVGGEFITFGFNSPAKINPFDLSAIYDPEENQLGLKILSLHSLFKIVMGEMTAREEAILDRALVETYRAKGITTDPATQNKEPPLMEDLYKTLLGMEDELAAGLASRIEKFIKGSFRGVFDHKTTVNLTNPFTVFSVRDLESALRPIAMFIVLDFIWTKIKRELKKRMLVVDEAWWLMQYPDSANFLYSVAKRARKYYLGLTTITQDVEDFLSTDIGKSIITNSSIQMLMKQSPAAIDRLGEVFYLSEGEKQLLLSADIGEGIFFAGANHVAIRVVASPEEHTLVTTRPSEVIARMKKEEGEEARKMEGVGEEEEQGQGKLARAVQKEGVKQKPMEATGPMRIGERIQEAGIRKQELGGKGIVVQAPVGPRPTGQAFMPPSVTISPKFDKTGQAPVGPRPTGQAPVPARVRPMGENMPPGNMIGKGVGSRD